MKCISAMLANSFAGKVPESVQFIAQITVGL